MAKTKKEFRFPIMLKTILMIVIFGAVLAEIAMIYFTLVSSNSNKENYKSLARDLSNTVALSVDKEKTTNVVNQIMLAYNECTVKPTRDQEGTEEYNNYFAKIEVIKQSQDFLFLKEYLNRVKLTNVDTDAIYLGAVDCVNKHCIYIVYDFEDADYPVGTVDPLYEEDYQMLEHPEIGFVPSIYEEGQGGKALVTAGAPVYKDDSTKKVDEIICYALVDISMTAVRNKQADSIVRLFIYLMSTVVLLSGIGILIINFIIIKPVKTLSKAAKSYDINDPEGTHKIFTNLKVNVHDELTDLANSMKNMENDINSKIKELTEMNKELIESQRVAQKMTELANKDALTGVRNKVSYNNMIRGLDDKIKDGRITEFGVAMVDLNYLKNINDDYGHDSGDAALIKLCGIICAIFAHSPVYRIGGDEFVVLLRNKDYENVDILVEVFNDKIQELDEDDGLKPMEKVSAAIGYSKFDPKKDTCFDDVFKRADKAMYERKRRMKEHDKNK